ncbi:MAG: ribose-5-phosphate isomerase A, partial [Anaerolineae bacterium]
ERIVAHASRCFLIVADERKLVRCLGTRVPLPVEVVPFGWTLAARKLAALGAKVERRLLGVEAVLTDEGNYLLDCHFGVIRDPVGLERAVQAIPGVVSHGLFLDMATMVIVGAREGLRLVRRSDAVRTRDASHTREAAKPE